MKVRIYAENLKFMKFVNMFQKVLVNKLYSLNRCENKVFYSQFQKLASFTFSDAEIYPQFSRFCFF